MRSIRFAFSLTVVMFLAVIMFSCSSQGDKGKPIDGKPGNVMKPTDEYNYLLSPEYWNEQAKNMQAVADVPGEMGQVAKMNEQLGYGEPEIKGMTDGVNIVLNASYPRIEEQKDIADVFAKIPSSKIGFSGKIRSEKMIGYVKFPGLQGMFDAYQNYYKVLIDKEQNPQGKFNPATSMVGALMMAGIDIQNDVFAWMGDENGFIFYKAVDPEGNEYLNTAFAMSIKDKAKAKEKIGMLLSKTMQLMNMKGENLITNEQYKTFEMDVVDLTSVTQSMGIAMGGIVPTEGGVQGGLLYTDDYLFISDTYGIKQFADIYEPGGAAGEPATFAVYIDFDAFAKDSARYQEQMEQEIKKAIEEMPEQMAKFEEYRNKFMKMVQDGGFGVLKMNYKFAGEKLELKVEVTKNLIELGNFMSEWFEAMMVAGEAENVETAEG